MFVSRYLELLRQILVEIDSYSQGSYYIFTDSFVKKVLEEKDQLEGQVNFLNSLIVDMQRKNDELKSCIEISEMGNVSDDTKANM